MNTATTCPVRSDELPATYPVWAWREGTAPLDLRLEERPLPPPAPDDVLVRNEVIGLNPVDWKVLGGAWMQPGHVPGVDGAGTVVALGDDVPERWLGQRVAYHQSLQRHGSFAAYVPIRAGVLLRLPDPLDFATAASFPCPALTAWLALEKLPRRPGEALLVSGAGGAVGHYLVQLAAARDWVVTAMCHPRHWDRLRTLGAHACREGALPPGEDWPSAGADRFVAVIDSVSADHAARLAPALRANGHLVGIQGRVEHWPCAPFGRALSMHEVALGALHQHGDSDDWARLTAAGEDMLRAIADGRLQPEAQVERRFAELPELLDALRHRQFSGKPLVRLELNLP